MGTKFGDILPSKACHILPFHCLPDDTANGSHIGQKWPFLMAEKRCCKLISMQSVDVIWQLQCWAHCHIVLVTVTFLYCFGYWPACYMELIMILLMVLRIRVMMGIAILEHLAKFLMGTNAIVMTME